MCSVFTRRFLNIISSHYSHTRLLAPLGNRGTLSNSLYICNRLFHPTQACHETISFKLSDIGEGIREVVIKEWYVKAGDAVHQFDPICEVQSDKATVTITSRYDGIVRALHYEPQGTCAVGQPLLDIELNMADPDHKPSEDGQTSSYAQELEQHQPVNVSDMERDKVLATPSVRRLAMENKINLAQVVGSGKDGRILKEDILHFISSGVKSPTPQFSEVAPKSTLEESEPSCSPVDSSEDKTVPLTLIQRAMKASMMQSNEIPHFVLSDELDLTKLVHMRDEISQFSLDRHNMKITYMPFFIKAASLALFEFPMLNAYADSDCDSVVYKGSHNIGVAMDTPDGLLVPNIKSVERLSIIQIATELKRLQDLGTRSKLGSIDLKEGTMTLSNIGSIGGTYTAPRILTPQVLIGGLGRIQLVPRFDGSGSVCASHVLNVSWAADHRVIDGATVARFCKLWRTYLENPILLSLALK